MVTRMRHPVSTALLGARAYGKPTCWAQPTLYSLCHLLES